MAKVSSTSERLKQIMQERHIRQVDIINAAQPYCNRLGIRLKKNDLSQYVSGRTIPGNDKVLILSYALNVSEPWLLGYDYPEEREAPTPSARDERTIQMDNLFRLLSDDEKDETISFVKWKLSKR